MTAEEALTQFLGFLDDDPLAMDGEELDAYLAANGFDFAAFDARLSKDIELAVKKARLTVAREGRESFLARPKKAIDIISMTIEQKRAEIQERLGLLGGQAAAVFNRKYEDVEEEDDLDDLLLTLRELDERQ